MECPKLEVEVRSYLWKIGTLVWDKEETDLEHLQEVKHVDLNNPEQVDVQDGLRQPRALIQMDPRKDKDKEKTYLGQLQELQELQKLQDVKHVDLNNLGQVDVQDGLRQPWALIQMDPRKDKDKEKTDPGQLQEVKHVDLNNLVQVDVQEGLHQPRALIQMDPREDNDEEETDLGHLQEVKHVDRNNLEQVDVQEGLHQPRALIQMDPREDNDEEETDLGHLQEVKHVDLNNLEQVDAQEGLEQPAWALKQMDPSDSELQEVQKMMKLKAFDTIQPVLLVDAVYQLSMDNPVTPEPSHLSLEKVFFLPLWIE